ncbi:DNA repair protein RecN [Boudabousia tangfeifanii]|uniref:DNA repair protein RecN n=1 Tax=Boudabousia tangfeifanii TaxID=1912795 RepID=A0A1D9MKK4_9ACTO|nr:DNA repair protein RecN [Boudabousia tangfeifanii]AOZ72816.1 DNA repair protein RecN [Boudabousia tangfeifanii]
MINEVFIENLGVIDSARLDLVPGFTAVTGETGAGKTMVLTGLGMLLGARTDLATVRLGAEQASVSGVFAELNQEANESLSGWDLCASDDEVFVSRTLHTKAGRSRARLQGRAVPVAALGEFSSTMVTIHGQSDQIALKNSRVQRQILDRFGNATHQALIVEYQNAWQAAVKAKRELDDWQANAQIYALESASLQEGLELYDELAPSDHEEEELTSLIKRLTNVSDLRQFVASAKELISATSLESSNDALGAIGSANSFLSKAERLDPSLENLKEQLVQLEMQIRDLGFELENYVATLEDDPNALTQAHERRAKLKKLMQGRAVEISELHDWAQEARQRLHDIGDPTATTELKQQTLKQCQETVLAVGKKLTSSRQKLALGLAQKVNSELAELAMKSARFTVELEDLPKPSSHGLEEITFMLQSHPSAPTRPIGAGASGGELSRIMLAIEVAAADNHSQSGRRTFIFDEVDSGIGGQAAIQVGKRLAKLAENSQVIVVTHLAQVAAFADQQVLLQKADGKTELIALTGSARETELARMLSGEATLAAAKTHAAELLAAAQSAKQ